ncbi:MAG: hypothetical protein ACI837_000689 [Crocinitomicaceae bacterium]|jgi:hypothetical protein
MTRRILFLIMLFPGILFSQTKEIRNLALESGKLQQDRLAEMFGENRDSIFQIFDSTLYRLFTHAIKVDDSTLINTDYFLVDSYSTKMKPVAIAYSLINKVVVSNSKDEKLRIISCDNLDGGSWHEYTNIIQTFDSQGAPRTQKLNPESTEKSVGYYNIEQITDDSSTFYIAFGYGSEGSGNHHRVVKVFKDFGDSIGVMDCFAGKSTLEIVSKRWQDVELAYNETKKTLCYREYIESYDEENGTFNYKSEEIVWHFQGGEFIR